MLIITGFSRGLSAKQPSYLLPQATHTRAPGGGGGGPGGHGHRRSGHRGARLRHKIERGGWDEHDGGAHLGRRTTTAVGIRRSTPAGWPLGGGSGTCAGRRRGYSRGALRQRARAAQGDSASHLWGCVRAACQAWAAAACPGRRRDAGPDGPRAGLRRRSGLDRASGSALSGR
jgi:hypothetical protein